MTAKQIRKWYHDHKVAYVKDDWRSSERFPHWGISSTGASTMDTPYLEHLESEGRAGSIWRPRNAADREYVEALEEFFAPYVAILPRPKGNLITEYTGMRRTQASLAESKGVTQQAVSKALMSAMRALVHIIAKDDPAYVPPQDGRRRDFEGETQAAERVFVRFWLERAEGRTPI